MKPITESKPTPRRLMRLRETCATAGVVDMTLRRMEKAGTFPKRIKINPDGGTFGGVAHDFDEVQEWVERRRASRDGNTGGA